MPRPQITVNITQELTRRGAQTATGTAFMVFAGATGPLEPTRCRSETAALAAGVPAPVAAWVGDALNEGAPEVYVVRVSAVDAAAVTEAEWNAGLATLTDQFGPGQVLIPGVSTAAAHNALLAHAATSGRVPLLDGPETPSAAALTAAVAGLGAAAGATNTGAIAPWWTVPATGGGTRNVPGSVIAAGLAARGDASVGHANHAPAGTHSGGAGVSRRAVGVTAAFTNAELDALHDAGVSVARMELGRPTLFGWRSISDDDLFSQLNIARAVMEVTAGIEAGMRQFLFRQIDGRGLLYAELEGSLRGYLLPMWDRGALFGATSDEAFDVQVAEVNTPETAGRGELHAAVKAKFSKHTESVTINVVISNPEGA